MVRDWWRSNVVLALDFAIIFAYFIAVLGVGYWLKDKMKTSADFAANPIGTFFNPARVYDKMKDGADFKTLQKSIRAGEYLPNPLPAHIGLPTP